jgi:hypothetical protein
LVPEVDSPCDSLAEGNQDHHKPIDQEGQEEDGSDAGEDPCRCKDRTLRRRGQGTSLSATAIPLVDPAIHVVEGDKAYERTHVENP